MVTEQALFGRTSEEQRVFVTHPIIKTPIQSQRLILVSIFFLPQTGKKQLNMD